jgi:cardiolipin synthase
MRVPRKPVTWTIILTVALTLVVTAFLTNFVTPEKKLERRILHQHSIQDAQFQRELSTLLGPLDTSR